MVQIPAGSTVYNHGNEPIGHVIDPNDPTPRSGTIATALIIPELADRKLFGRRRKKPMVVAPTQMTKLWRADVPEQRDALAWLEVRDSLVDLCGDARIRADLCRLADWPGITTEMAYQTIPRIARLLMHATVTIWKADRWDAAISGASAFEETPLEPGDGTGGPELWLLEAGPVMEPPTLGLDRPCQVIGILVVGSREREQLVPDGLGWFVIGAPQLPEAWWGSAKTETTFPDPALAANPDNWMPRIKALPGIGYGEPVLPYAAPLVAAGQFLRQTFIERRPEPLPRQQRRHYERKKPGHATTIYAIVLRRTEYQYEKKGTTPVDWQWQWHSAGHWVHPKSDRYKDKSPFYRRGCWKGPADAPIKPPGERIYHVKK